MNAKVVAVLFPVAGLVVGGAIGRVTRGGAGESAPATASAALDQSTRAVPLGDTTDPATIDPGEVVGLVTDGWTTAPGASAVLLGAGAASPAFLDDNSGVPVDPVAPSAPGPAATADTVGGPAGSCTPGTCAGRAAMVGSADVQALAPLAVSVPFVASGAFADLCDRVEGDAVPDPALAPAQRPTIAILTNQPASVALDGTWSDGTPLGKLTMRTSQQLDEEWRTQWDDGVQRRLVACLTLPLDVARQHAAAGRAAAWVDALAVGADGRAVGGGSVEVHVPLDGSDAPFVDAVTVDDLGERPFGTALVPVVAVHYSVDSAALLPTVDGLDRFTARPFARHSFVEGADCAGWVINRQGRDRTLAVTVRQRSEQRTIGGRSRNVVVVDAEVWLDPTLPGGWEGSLCVQLGARDDNGHVVTTAIRGAAVRSPRGATIALEVALAGDSPRVDAVWSTPGGGAWCGPATLTPATPTATCTTYARLVPGGAVVTVVSIGADGRAGSPLAVTFPVGNGYCTPDDPHADQSAGCGHGSAMTVVLPGSEPPARVTIAETRTAVAGRRATDPSARWLLGDVSAYGG